MFIDPATLLSAFSLGLLGSAHCLGMCGGLAAALGLSSHSPSSVIASDTSSHETRREPNTNNTKQNLKLIAYNFGRISSYVIAGLIVGSLGFWLSKQIAALLFLRYLSAILLILMGLYIANWFNGILYIEKLGRHLWQFIQPLARRFMPVRSTGQSYIVGMIWGWLPCGLVYSALIWAGSQGSVSASACVMLAFGAGTLPSMLATGLFAQQMSTLLKNAGFRSFAGILMITLGIASIPIVQEFITTRT